MESVWLSACLPVCWVGLLPQTHDPWHMVIHVCMYVCTSLPNLNLLLPLCMWPSSFPPSSIHFVLPFLTIPKPTSCTQFFHLLESSVSFKYTQYIPKKETKETKTLFTFNALPSCPFQLHLYLLPYSSQFLPTKLMHPILFHSDTDKSLTFTCHHVPSRMILNLYLRPTTIVMSFPNLPPIFFLPTNQPLQAPEYSAFACHHAIPTFFFVPCSSLNVPPWVDNCWGICGGWDGP